ncbi:MAG: N-acetylmuramoyl-L-alanine amidase [Anaerolineae bacterium]|nr:N-acetylmuramoyl-L-alanine amidase [Phycisphaerae bacterium]
MARSHLTLVSIGLLLLLVLLLLVSGCQAPAASVAQIPAPNFNGPVVVAPMSAPQVAVKQTQITPPRKANATAGVPKNWTPYATARPWKWIVIHHSATPRGGAVAFNRMHQEKGWDELGYHFVIGNGTDTADGQIEVGPRWPKQKWGAHAKTPNNEFNERGIGICLVGNFDLERPTPEQMRALTKLTTYLMKTYRIRPQDVIGHGETKATDCPGRFINLAALRRQLANGLADGTDLVLPVELQSTPAIANEPQPAADSATRAPAVSSAHGSSN